MTSNTFSRSGALDCSATDAGLGGGAQPWSEQFPGRLVSQNGSVVVEGRSVFRAGFPGLTFRDIEVSAVITSLPTGGLCYFDIHNQGLLFDRGTSYRLRISRTNIRLGSATSALANSNDYTFSIGDCVGIRAKGDKIALLRNGTVLQTLTSTIITTSGFLQFRSDATDPTGFGITGLIVRIPPD